MQGRIIADVGGTSLRLGLVHEDEVVVVQETACDDWHDLATAIIAFLGSPKVASHAAPVELVVAVAAPVGMDGMVRMTNRGWQFSGDSLRESLPFSRIAILNDFEALALSLPYLEEGDVHVIRQGKPHAHAPVLVMGAGTGFGMAALVSCAKQGGQAVATEAGHASLCAETSEEQAIFAALHHVHGHVSVEKVFSGPGLVAMAHIMADLRQIHEAPATPEAIVAGMHVGDGFCRDVLAMFAGWLGRFCGDMALCWGARGGVFLAGGLLQGLGGLWLSESCFLLNFCAKGRFSSYLEAVPVRLITCPMPAFPGLAHFQFPED